MDGAPKYWVQHDALEDRVGENRFVAEEAVEQRFTVLWLGFVLSHPFHKVREKDGTPGTPQALHQKEKMVSLPPCKLAPRKL